jgi:hypothetical protein
MSLADETDLRRITRLSQAMAKYHSPPIEQIPLKQMERVKAHGKPLTASDIFAGLVAGGYKFNSSEARKRLFDRIYRLKGVKQVRPGRFAAD